MDACSAIFVIVFGALIYTWPRAYWYLQHGLFVRGGEPAPHAIVYYRVIGAFVVVLGVGVLVSQMFGCSRNG